VTAAGPNSTTWAGSVSKRRWGDKIKTTFVETSLRPPISERVFRQLASDGYKLIFATSFGYMEPLQKVAKLFPDVKFEHVNGFKTGANISVYEPRFEEGFYLIGVIAGQMTKTNTLGFIGSFPIPTVIRNIDAMTLGAQSVNPKIKTKAIWVNTWYDPGKERQAADTLIAQGADAVAQNTDSPASIQAAQEKGTYAFSIDADMSSFGKKGATHGLNRRLERLLHRRTKKVLDGSWTGARRTRWGIKEGLVVMAPLNPDIPPARRQDLRREKKQDHLRRAEAVRWTDQGQYRERNGRRRWQQWRMPQRVRSIGTSRASRAVFPNEPGMSAALET